MEYCLLKKRVLRICRARDIKSAIKYASHSCTRRVKEPQYVAENLLDCHFHADKPNQKQPTDLNLFDRRIVPFVTGDSNNSPLVFKTLDKMVKANPNAHPLFHSDRWQHTTRTFHHKLKKTGMLQSMSRMAHCINNGPIEGFWGYPKAGYDRRFTSRQSLVQMIRNYILYYNTHRVQRNLGVLHPWKSTAWL